ncbi:MAG: transcription termination/antitermination protein NusG [Oscillospiraceae bacterium]|nr:transcription termination/antitermination protein NusG [Oscillospiraceae bacterium]
MSEEEKSWYVVQTHSGHENKVASGIKSVMESRGITGIEEIKIPTEHVTEIKNNKKYDRVRKIFPGYIFLKMGLSNDIWHALRNVKGCVGFVGDSLKPSPLSAKEAEKFGVEEPVKIEIPYKVGDSVQVVEGPLDGFFGVVSEIDLEKEVVNVIVSMFGRETPVELHIDDIEAIV